MAKFSYRIKEEVCLSGSSLELSKMKDWCIRNGYMFEDSNVIEFNDGTFEIRARKPISEWRTVNPEFNLDSGGV